MLLQFLAQLRSLSVTSFSTETNMMCSLVSFNPTYRLAQERHMNPQHGLHSGALKSVSPFSVYTIQIFHSLRYTLHTETVLRIRELSHPCLLVVCLFSLYIAYSTGYQATCQIIRRFSVKWSSYNLTAIALPGSSTYLCCNVNWCRSLSNSACKTLSLMPPASSPAPRLRCSSNAYAKQYIR